MWTVSLLVLVIYVFAIFFSDAVYHADIAGTFQTLLSVDKDNILLYFGSLSRAMYTLLASVLGGVDWMACSSLLRNMHVGYELVFVTYIFFAQMGLLNVVTGIFVDSSMNAALGDKQMLIQEEMMREGISKEELKKLFEEADSERAGLVPKAELQDFLSDVHVRAYLKVLDINYSDARQLVAVLDSNRDGLITSEEFIEACLKLKSEQVTDVYSVMRSNKHALSSIKDRLTQIAAHYGHLRTWLQQTHMNPAVSQNRAPPRGCGDTANQFFRENSGNRNLATPDCLKVVGREANLLSY